MPTRCAVYVCRMRRTIYMGCPLSHRWGGTWQVKSLPNAEPSLIGHRELYVCASHFDCKWIVTEEGGVLLLLHQFFLAFWSPGWSSHNAKNERRPGHPALHGGNRRRNGKCWTTTSKILLLSYISFQNVSLSLVSRMRKMRYIWAYWMTQAVTSYSSYDSER